MPPSKHAMLGASKAYQWIACPPSARINAALPEQTSSYAAEGTQAHEVCEQILRAAVTAWSLGDGGTQYPIDGLPEDMVKAALVYEDFIQEIYAGFENEPGVFIEQRVDFGRWVPEGFGTCDCLLIGDGVLHVVDFKYGAGVPVSPDHNPQMMCYALGAYDMFAATDQISTVRMSIVQPRIQEEPETFEMPAEELLAWAADTLALAAVLAYQGEGELHADEKTCKFCKAYPRCPAWAERYGPLADFEPYTPADQLGDAALGDWLQKLQGLTSYAQDLQDYALQQILDGKAIPGWKAVEGRGTRSWTDQDAAFTAVVGAGFADAVLYKPRERITLTETEKLLGKKQFNTICGDFVAKTAGKPKLAPADDKRPALDKLEGFENV